MRLRITDAVRKVAEKRFHEMLQAGAFPQVNFVKTPDSTSYNLIEYVTVWATYMKVVDKLMKINIDPELGAFTRKRSVAMLKTLETMLQDVTQEQVYASEKRFSTMFD